MKNIFNKNNIKIAIPTLCLIFLFSSCTNDKKEIDSKEVRKVNLVDSFNTIINSNVKSELIITPSDTIIELLDDIEVVLWEESFLNKNNSIYNGPVHFTYNFLDSSDLIFLQSSKRHTILENLILIVEFEVKDSLGTPLLINPKFSTILRFHPKLKMLACSYFQYDDENSKYTTPIKFTERIAKLPIQKGETIVVPINFDFVVKDSSKVKKSSSPRKQEIIGYEMTLKNSGFYYISKKNKEENLQVVNVNIQATQKSKFNLNWKNVKLFLFTNQNDYNYYLRAENYGDGNFKIVPAPGYTQVKLPLDNEYTLLAYGINGDKCYFFKDKVKLNEQQSFNIELKNVGFKKLLREIRKL